LAAHARESRLIKIAGQALLRFQIAPFPFSVDFHHVPTGTDPTATILIKSALPLRGNQPNGVRRYQLDGQFTLHGGTRPLRFFAEARAESGGIRLRGAFALLQTDYGVKPFSKALVAVGVTDKLKIYGDILIVAARN
jgi:hypothetical protein